MTAINTSGRSGSEGNFPIESPGTPLPVDIASEPKILASDRVIRSVTEFHGDYEALFTSLWGDSFSEAVMGEIEEFSDGWKDKIDQLKGGYGWKAMKKDVKENKIAFTDAHASGSNDKSWETFRLEAVELMKRCVNHRLQELGLPQIEVWGGVGTPGLDSDIDLSLEEFSKDGSRILKLGEKELMLAKALGESFLTHLLGGVSGEKIDTEIYVRHNGRFENYNNLQTQKGREIFNLTEAFGVALVAYKHFTHDGDTPDAAAWIEYKDSMCKTLKLSPQEATAIFDNAATLINTQREERTRHVLEIYFKNHPDSAIPHASLIKMDGKELEALLHQIMEGNHAAIPELETNAFYYAHPQLMKLSSDLDSLSKQIEQLEQKLTSPRPEEDIGKIKESIDLLRNKFVYLSIVRVTCFPEGYYTEGSYKRVVRSAGGQIYQRKFEEIQRAFAKSGVASTQELNEFSTSTLSDHFESSNENFVLWLKTMTKSKEIIRVIESSKYGQRFMYDDIQMVKTTISHTLKALSSEINRVKSILDPLNVSLGMLTDLDAALKLLEETVSECGQDELTHQTLDMHIARLQTYWSAFDKINSMSPSEDKNKLIKIVEEMKEGVNLLMDLRKSEMFVEELLVSKRDVKVSSSGVSAIFETLISEEIKKHNRIRDDFSKQNLIGATSEKTSANFADFLIREFEKPEIGYIQKTPDNLFHNLDGYFKEPISDNELNKLSIELEQRGFRIEYNSDIKSAVKDIASKLKNLTHEKKLQILSKYHIRLHRDLVIDIVKSDIETIRVKLQKMSKSAAIQYLKDNKIPLPKKKWGFSYDPDPKQLVLDNELKNYMDKTLVVPEKNDAEQRALISLSQRLSPIIGAKGQYAELTQSDSYNLAFSIIQRTRLFATVGSEALDPRLKTNIEAVLGVGRSRSAEVKRSVRREATSVSLSKIPDVDAFAEKLKKLHYRTFEYVAHTGMLPMRVSEELPPIRNVWETPHIKGTPEDRGS